MGNQRVRATDPASVKMRNLARINVRGVVQGVGFRPFVYRLAHQYNLKGWVRNTSGNVAIEAEGDAQALDNFLANFEAKAPPRAQIEEIEITFHSAKGYTDFVIRKSLRQKGERQLVSPDIATCDNCKREIFSPTDRRFRYPFTNCTDCGPRFTIIKDIPYDRSGTTMHKFIMCRECQQEYDQVQDRRFHAQPNACYACGPSLELADKNGTPIQCDDVIETASELLNAGNVLAIKGLGGFHLACDATNETVVKQLRKRKTRPSKPLAVMIKDLTEVEKHCSLIPEERALLESPQCPIVLLKWKQHLSNISSAVAPNSKALGVMLPYTPLHHILLRDVERPLVMTSGNLSGEPLAKDNEEALCKLGKIADYFLFHDRDIYVSCDDSVCMVEEGIPQVIRRARGYAPYPILLPFESEQLLACGAELKNTFCLTHGAHAFLSQHIGDMENEETLRHFENTIELYEQLFRIEPDRVAYDMHPEYISTKYALELGSKRGLKLIAVQHHHAHIVSCLVDNGNKGPVIGVAFDGTGYGTDGKIWGGEFLVADWHGFERVGQLEYVPLPGGEAAIKKPYRMALSYIYTLLGEDFCLEDLPLNEIDPIERDVIRKQIKQGINSPATSSAGRLFDAISAITGVRKEIDYDAQAAIELEMRAQEETRGSGAYPFTIDEQQTIRVARLAELIAAIIHDIKNGVSSAIVSRRFHHTVACLIATMCKRIAKDRGIDQVALSGGVFQNRLLLRSTIAALKEEGFTVLTHRLVPCNDAGISLGQAVIANFQ
jgi:hydrogenase maturation protein HypF